MTTTRPTVTRYYAWSVGLHGAVLGCLALYPPVEVAPTRPPPTEFIPLALPPPAEPPSPAQATPPESASPARPAEVRASRPSPPRVAAARPAEPLVNAEASSDSASGLLRLTGPGFSNAGFALGTGGPGTTLTPNRAPATVTKVRSKTEDAPPPMVALGSLARRPEAPRLDERLRQHYPKELERTGVEGEALVALTLSETGRVVHAQAVSASQPAFGDACRRTLLGSEWTAPHDRSGNPVRTTLTYRCRFRVSR